MAKLENELLVITPNEVGMLAKITGAIAGGGVNITAICAYVVGDEGHFRIMTSDNTKAKSTLEPLGFKISEREVISVELENKIGATKELAGKLAQAGIDLKNIYGATSGTNSATLILTADNNQKAKDIIG